MERAKIVGALASDPDWRVRAELCQHPQAYHHVGCFGHLSDDPEYEVRLAFASAVAKLDPGDCRYGPFVQAALSNTHGDDFMGDLLVRAAGREA